jgi:hypothetical protein
VRVEPLAIAHEIVVGSDRKVSAIRFKRPDGSVDEARGKVFVIAAHAVETPKLLLMSRIPGSDVTVANSSGQVGRNLLTQLDAGMAGLTKDKLYPYRGPGGDERHTRAARRRLSQSSWRLRHVAVERGWYRAIGPFKAAERYAAQGLTGARSRPPSATICRVSSRWARRWNACPIRTIASRSRPTSSIRSGSRGRASHFGGASMKWMA